MRKPLSNPLTWMIVGECVVVATLMLLAWHWIAAAQVQPSAAAPLSLPAATQDPTAGASPAASQPPKAVSRPLPGLSVDTAFWRLRLDQLNREQAAFELLEWKIVHSAIDTIHRYMESVVLPAVERAERGGG